MSKVNKLEQLSYFILLIHLQSIWTSMHWFKVVWVSELIQPIELVLKVKWAAASMKVLQLEVNELIWLVEVIELVGLVEVIELILLLQETEEIGFVALYCK